MPAHFLATLPNFLAYLGAAIVLLVAFVAIYLYVTPYDEINPDPQQQHGGGDFAFRRRARLRHAHRQRHRPQRHAARPAVWGVIAGIVQLLAWGVARVALPTLKEDIAAGRWRRRPSSPRCPSPSAC
jgi:putative membrane protein